MGMSDFLVYELLTEASGIGSRIIRVARFDEIYARESQVFIERSYRIISSLTWCHVLVCVDSSLGEAAD